MRDFLVSNTIAAQVGWALIALGAIVLLCVAIAGAVVAVLYLAAGIMHQCRRLGKVRQ